MRGLAVFLFHDGIGKVFFFFVFVNAFFVAEQERPDNRRFVTVIVNRAFEILYVVCVENVVVKAFVYVMRARRVVAVFHKRQQLFRARVHIKIQTFVRGLNFVAQLLHKLFRNVFATVFDHVFYLFIAEHKTLL